MRWSRRIAGALVAAALLAVALLVSGSGDEKHISVYSESANYTLPVVARNGVDYVGLSEILAPLGRVTAKTDGPSWKLRFNNVEGEFVSGKARGRVQRRELDLPANFLLENGRGLVPLNSLSTLIPQFLGEPVNFHESSRRLFIGNVAVHFTAQISKTPSPSLVMNFTSPVNPMVATEPSKLRLVFTHEPLVPPGAETLTFDSKTIPSATYAENDGAAEIAITGSVSLFASFSNQGRTITIAPAPQAAAPALTQAPVRQTAPNPQQLPPESPVPNSGINRPVPYFAVVDASHGGDDRGAALTDQLAEKDVTLAFARRLRQELEARAFATLMLRDGDVRLSLDERATLSNAAHPAIYICLHATSQGLGVRLYTPMLSEGSADRGPFLDWARAQSGFRAASQTAQASLAAEFIKRQVPVRSLIAPLRPLNNIATAAVAIEISPPAGGISGLTSSAYQQLVAESVASGAAAVRDKLESKP